MSLNFLDFEQPIAELEAKIDSLTAVSRQDEKLDINIDEEVHRLREKSVELTRKIFADLGAWQIAQLARHPQRPYTLDYVRLAFDEFDELAGDRAYADDKAIVGGIARLDGRPVMIIGHQKGRETKEKIRRNFGMPAPEGYRKALRLMQMAERFKMPIITFIDTPGAYPGKDAEERGQGEAIARNLMEMSGLTVPVIAVVTGEGSSGGALALGIAAHNNVQEKPLPQPRHIVVVSPGEVPWNDAERARMQALNERDVAIDYAFMVTVEKFMRHGCENVPDYMLSGSRGDFTGVGDIHFFYSADEVLYGALPDFEEACKRAKVPYTVSARPKMVHCYCMLPIFKEAKEDFAKIVDILKK